MKKLYRAKEVVVLMAVFADEVRNYPAYNNEMEKTLKQAEELLDNSDRMIDFVRSEDEYVQVFVGE